MHLDHFLVSYNMQEKRPNKEYRKRGSMQHFLRMVFQSPAIRDLGTTKTEATLSPSVYFSMNLSNYFWIHAQYLVARSSTLIYHLCEELSALVWFERCTSWFHFMPPTCTSTEHCAHTSSICTVQLWLQITQTNTEMLSKHMNTEFT